MADADQASESPAPSYGVRGSVLRGSALMLTMRWLVRFTGLISTIILVRILTPEDFGLVAMAMLVVGFVDLFSDTALDLALIRHPNPDRSHFDSAWSASATITMSLGVLLTIIASPVAAYFAEPRVEFIVYALSLKVFLVGFENVGVVWFRRNLDFYSEFRYGVVRRMVPKFVTIGLAFWLRDYRALVYGEVFASVFALGLTYYVHPFRPRLDYSKVTELWSFSIWILIADVGEYLHQSVGRLVVGTVTNAATLGRFAIGEELARLPNTELVGPLSHPLYPAYAKFHDDRPRLLDAYLNVLSVTATMGASTAAGVAVVARDALDVGFGAQWVSVAPTMAWLAIACGIYVVSSSVSVVLNALGLARRTAILTWSTYAAMLSGLIITSHMTADIARLAATSAALTLLLAPAYFLVLRTVLPVKWSDVAAAVWRPVLAAAAMAGILVLTKQVTGDFPSAVRLVFEVVLGGLLFPAALAGLWVLSGRPNGAEQIGFDLLLDVKDRIWKPAS